MRIVRLEIFSWRKSGKSFSYKYTSVWLWFREGSFAQHTFGRWQLCDKNSDFIGPTCNRMYWVSPRLLSVWQALLLIMDLFLLTRFRWMLITFLCGWLVGWSTLERIEKIESESEFLSKSPSHFHVAIIFFLCLILDIVCVHLLSINSPAVSLLCSLVFPWTVHRTKYISVC